MTLSYHTLCAEAGMSSRPSYYSGRGATLSDLDSKILETMYRLIESNVGKDNADQFVRMVASIKVLSATDFLITLERFVDQNFTWTNDSHTSDAKGIYADNFGSALATVAEVFGNRGRQRDDTMAIRAIFIAQHRDAVPNHKEEREWHGMRRQHGHR